MFVQDVSVAEKKKQISSSAVVGSQSGEATNSKESKTVSSSNSAQSLNSMDNSPNLKSSDSKGDYLVASSSSIASGPSEQRKNQEQDQDSKLATTSPKLGTTSDTSPGSASGATNRKSGDNRSVSPVSYTSNFSALVSPNSFNGVGNCAVFPVPISSLSVSIWRNLLHSGTGDDLKVNPYAMISIPITELFELTIPPVDAACVSSWPRPLSYYSQGVGASGVTHGPPGQHSYRGATVTSSEPSQGSQQPSQNEMSPEQIQQYHQQKAYQQQQQRVNHQFRESQQQQYAQHQFSQQQQQHQQPNMAALQQIFPGVNMSFGGQGNNSAKR